MEISQKFTAFTEYMNFIRYIFFYEKGIITESKSGRRAILADRVIDCTGDADVAYLAGAEYRYV